MFILLYGNKIINKGHNILLFRFIFITV